MSKQQSPTVKPLEMNKQFVQAFKWLRSNAGIESYKELAERLGTSPTTVSGIINYRKEVSELNALRMNKLLSKHGWTLKDFDKDYLNNQETQPLQISKEEYYSMMVTKMAVLQACMEVVMQKLGIAIDNSGELPMRHIIKKTKKTGIKSV